MTNWAPEGPPASLQHDFDDDIFVCVLPYSFLGWCHAINVAVGGRQNWWEWVILRGGMCSRQGRMGKRVGGVGGE